MQISDEIDSIGQDRDGDQGTRQALTQILNECSALDDDYNGVVTIAATNKPGGNNYAMYYPISVQ